jgi:Coenzyme PQQ synthesis protein D (PqqD)
MDWDLRPRRTPDIELTEVVDGFVVYDPSRDRIHFLNPTAAFVLESCDGEILAGELPALVAAGFQLDTPPVDDVEACLATLLREGLLIRPGDAAEDTKKR